MIATLTRSRLVLWWLHLAPMFLAVEAAMMMHRVQSRQLLSGSFEATPSKTELQYVQLARAQ